MWNDFGMANFNLLCQDLRLFLDWRRAWDDFGTFIQHRLVE
jgi:hypothetical protein